MLQHLRNVAVGDVTEGVRRDDGLHIRRLPLQNTGVKGEYVAGLRAGGWLALVREYPVLGRLLATLCRHWVEATVELARRLEVRAGAARFREYLTRVVGQQAHEAQFRAWRVVEHHGAVAAQPRRDVLDGHVDVAAQAILGDVALGGGHGLAATLQALTQVTPDLTAVVTVAGFLIGGLLVMPVLLLIAVTILAFGPWWGFLYAFIGMTASAMSPLVRPVARISSIASFAAWCLRITRLWASALRA